MALKKLFSGLVTYPSSNQFGDVPRDYQYQPDNQTRYKGKGRKLTLEEAFEGIQPVGAKKPVAVK